jgi:YD repeat-containing protein
MYFNAFGRLSIRRKLALGQLEPKTSAITSTVDQVQTFEYDELDRLITATVSGAGT